MYWNEKEIEKEWKKLNVPKKYNKMVFDTKIMMENQIIMTLGLREDGGKTTNALLKVLCMAKTKDFKCHIQYQRCDKNQITEQNISSLFDTIVNCGYIETLTDGKYNNVKYVPHQHKFYFSNVQVIDGERIETICDDFFCRAICLEKYIDYKSAINDPYADIIVFDEIFDTSRSTQRQMIELMNNVSTFFRPLDRQDEKGAYGKLILLGNTTNKFSFWFDEFCIARDIENLKFGSYIRQVTELGTTFSCHLLAQSEELKEKHVKSNIAFFGFNTPKMNAFNGLQEWQQDTYQHILYDDMINDSTLLDGNIFLYFRNRYVRLEVYKHNEIGHFIFAHYSKQPKHAKVIFTEKPQEVNHVFGFGEREISTSLKNGCKTIYNIIASNRMYYASNSVGQFISEYSKETRKFQYF